MKNIRKIKPITKAVTNATAASYNRGKNNHGLF